MIGKEYVVVDMGMPMDVFLDRCRVKEGDLLHHMDTQRRLSTVDARLSVLCLEMAMCELFRVRHEYMQGVL